MARFVFFSEDKLFVLKEKGKLREWFSTILETEHKKAGLINFIFCNDNYLLKLNRKFLNKNTYTDILAFQNNETNEPISGDIFISIQRVNENSTIFNTTFSEELKRVMAHGILHLSGYIDNTKTEKDVMREKEDFYLKMF